MPDFNELLDRDPTTFERPPTAPEGEYLCVIESKQYGQSSQKKTPFVEFRFKPSAPLESVPPELIADIDLTKVKFRDEFYLTPEAMFRLREFFETVDCVMETTRESIDAAVGQQVVVTIGHQASTRDPSRVFANVTQYLKAE